MDVFKEFNKLKPIWTYRITNSMARGADVREDFQTLLSKFFDLIIQASQTGEPSWVDGILGDWSLSFTQSDLIAGEKNITVVLNHILIITFEVARENLPSEDAMNFLGMILPVFNYALVKASQYETESRVAFVSNELESVQKKLERLDRTKSRFISVAAHELRTPLTLVEGYAAMIGEGSTAQDSASIEPLICGINNGIRRLRSIIDDMIDVSLIDSDLLSLNFQPVWLGKLFELLFLEHKKSSIDRKLSFTLHPFPGSDIMLFSDPERLYQAFSNVLSNAVKFTPDGGKITVDGRLLPGFIEVTITDTGIGISEQDQDHIFSKFGQLGEVLQHSSGKNKFKGGGPGLGLAIARGIIEAHGGTIWVDSLGFDEIKCPGSIFHVLLPIRTESPDSKLSKLFSSQDSRNET